jgi:protein-L-isoaspartate(D-aspartate) O-methyltransferase
VGFEKESPFDKILVSASAENIPEELIEQLKIGGTLVIPVKQSIYVLKKQKEGNEITEYEGFVFVPLLRG